MATVVRIIVSAVNQAGSVFNQVASQGGQMGDKLKGMGQGLTAGVTLPIVGLGIAVAKTAMDFQQSMNNVQAISEATGAEMNLLREQAKKMGAETAFSAKDAADAQGILASAGLNVKQIMTALPPTLQLAAAGNIGLGQAADIATAAMNQFKLQATDLPRINDVLAKAAAASNAGITDLGEAIKYVGSISSNVGYNINETVAALGLLANAGVKGSSAGTGLSSILESMIKPTKEATATMQRLGITTTDAAGKMLPLSSIIDQFTKKAATNKDILTVFGVQGGRTFLSLKNQGVPALQALQKQLDNSSGSAQKMADTMNAGLPGATKNLSSAFEGLLLAIADSGFLDMVAKGVVLLTSLVSAASKLPKPVLAGATVVLSLLAAIGPLLIIMGSLISAWTTVTAAAAAAAPILAGAGAVIGLIFSPVGLAIAALIALGVAVGALAANWDRVSSWFRANLTAFVSWWMTAFTSVRTTVSNGLNAVWNVVRPFFTALGAFLTGVGKLLALPFILWATAVLWEVEQVMTTFNILKPYLQSFANFVGNIFRAIANTVGGILSAIWTGVSSTVSRIVSWAGAKLQEFAGLVGRIGSYIYQGIVSALSPVVSWVANIMQQVVNVVLGIGHSLWNAGVRIVQMFIQGFQAAFDSAVANFQAQLQRVRNLLPSSDAKTGPLSDISRTGGGMMQTFADGISANPVVSALDSALSGVAATASGGSVSPVPVGAGASGDIIFQPTYTIEVGAGTTKEIVNDLIEQLRERDRELLDVISQAQSRIGRANYR